jgi:hypothetical protein
LGRGLLYAAIPLSLTKYVSGEIPLRLSRCSVANVRDSYGQRRSRPLGRSLVDRPELQWIPTGGGPPLFIMPALDLVHVVAAGRYDGSMELAAASVLQKLCPACSGLIVSRFHIAAACVGEALVRQQLLTHNFRQFNEYTS